MNLKALVFVVLVATAVVGPIFANAKYAASLEARSKVMFNAGRKGVQHVLNNHVVKATEAAKALAAGTVAKRSTNAQCNALKSCGACVADTTCVWAIGFGIVGPENNPTGFGNYGICVSGTAAGGPTSKDDLMSVDIFGDGGSTNPAYWSSNLACADPFRVVNLDEAGGAGDGAAMRAAVEIDSTFGYVVSVQELQNNLQLPEDQQKTAMFNMIAKMFTGIRMYNTLILAHGGQGATDRAGFFMFFLALDLGEFMKAIFAALASGKEYDGMKDGVQSVSFLAFFDAINTNAYSAGVAGGGAAMATIPITGLTLSSSGSTTTNPPNTINTYTMSGSVGPAPAANFALTCYLAKNSWTHLGNTISPNAFECDITLNSLAQAAANSGAAYGVTLRVIIVALDIDMTVANSGARAADGNVNAGNADFTILKTANAGASSPGTSVNVLVKTDPTCASSSFLTPEAKSSVTQAYGGKFSPFCVGYSFDVASPNYIFWDPAGAINEQKAQAAADAKYKRSGAASAAPFVLAVIVAALMAVFAL